MLRGNIISYLALGVGNESLGITGKMSDAVLGRLEVGRHPKRAIKKAIDTYYGAFLNELKSHLKAMNVDSLRMVLSALDEADYLKRQPAGRRQLDKIMNAAVRSTGTDPTSLPLDEALEVFSGYRTRALVLIAEGCLLFSSGTLQDGYTTDKHMMDTVWLADETVNAARLSDLAHYVGGVADFRILDDGRYEARQNTSLYNELLRLTRLFAAENKDVASTPVPTDGEKQMFDLVTSYERFDPIFQERYGYGLTDAASFLKSLITDFNDCIPEGTPQSVCQFTRYQFLELVVQRTDLSKSRAKRILSRYILTSGKIRQTEFPDWRFPRKITINNRPILGFKIEDEHYLCFTPRLCKNALGILLSYPIDLQEDSIAEEFKQELTSAFEYEVYDAFKRRGFETLRNKILGPGEIDILAHHGRSSTLVLVECKAPIVRLDIRHFKRDLKRLDEWNDKLRQKIRWSRQNIHEVDGAENWGRLRHVTAIIVTQRPYPQTSAQGVKILHPLELNSWIETEFPE